MFFPTMRAAVREDQKTATLTGFDWKCRLVVAVKEGSYGTLTAASGAWVRLITRKMVFAME